MGGWWRRETLIFVRMIKNNKEEVTLINSHVKGTFMEGCSPSIWHNVVHRETQ